MLPAYNTVRKLYFYKLISFSVLTTFTSNVNIFDKMFEDFSFLTCQSTETGAVTQHMPTKRGNLKLLIVNLQDNTGICH